MHFFVIVMSLMMHAADSDGYAVSINKCARFALCCAVL